MKTNIIWVISVRIRCVFILMPDGAMDGDANEQRRDPAMPCNLRGSPSFQAKATYKKDGGRRERWTTTSHMRRVRVSTGMATTAARASSSKHRLTCHLLHLFWSLYTQKEGKFCCRTSPKNIICWWTPSRAKFVQYHYKITSICWNTPHQIFYSFIRFAERRWGKWLFCPHLQPPAIH